MIKIIVRKRFYVEIGLTALATSLGLLTLGWPDWIEALTGLDADAHNGYAEWLIVTGLFLGAAASALLARREYLRTRTQTA
jgi:hypothetical protein